MFELFCCFAWPVGWLISIATTIFWIWMLVEIATKEDSKDNRQLVWILVVAITHVIGALIYFFVRREERIRELGE